MPHRYERCRSEGIDKLLVDGPLTPSFIKKFAEPQPNAAQAYSIEGVLTSQTILIQECLL